MRSTSAADNRIAIVGIGCRFPGGADSPSAFWRLLSEGREAFGPMPAGRFDAQRLVDPKPKTPGRLVTAEGGFLEKIDEFDATFFGISPREAQKIDPQQRVLLEVAWEALEDAGIVPSALAGSRTGVYVGLWSGEYEHVMARRLEDMDLYATTGGGRYAASGRIAFALDLRGPTMSVDTACSSSLVSVHLGCGALRAGEADVVLAGGVNLILQPFVSIAYSRSGMLSPAARCRFGAPEPDGYVRSEGAAVVVLKRLADAVRDGDRVYAVVLGSAVNSDGRGSDRLVAPSLEAQIEMLRSAYAQAGVDPRSVDFVEAHGTGTAAGDLVELSSLGTVLGAGRAAPLPVGSVKRLIGHTEAASGMAGLIKAALAITHGEVPPGGHETERNPQIPWAELSVRVATDRVRLDAARASVVGVNSFGVTGTNAHVVLAGAPGVADGEGTTATPGARVVTVSGRSTGALDQAVAHLAGHLESHAELSLDDVAYTTTCRREHHPVRLAVVAESTAEVVTALRAHAAGETVPQVVAAKEPVEGEPAVAFVFSGQGSQWAGMGRTLLGWAPEFTDVMHRCDALVRELAGWSLLEVLEVLEEDGRDRLERVEVIQPALACMQIALAAQLRAWGVHPRAVVGHSMGEVAAAYVAGALSLEEALRVIVVRSRLLSEIAGHGAMALIDLDEATVRERIAPLGGQVSIGSVNGPRSTVVSGDPALIDALLAQLEDEDVFCRRVKVDVASHSVQTEPLLERLRGELAALRPAAPAVTFYSTARPWASSGAALDADYWADNLRQPVALLAAVRAMIAEGIDTFVEVAPHPVLLSSLADIAADADARVRTLVALRREEPEARRLLELMARLHVLGAPVAWRAIAPAGAKALSLPAYPWQRERHWLDRWIDWSADDDGASRGTAMRPASADDSAYVIDWRPLPAAPQPLAAGGRWIVVADQEADGFDLASRLHARGASIVVVTSDEALVAQTRAAGATLQGVVDLRPGFARLPDDASATVFAATVGRAYGAAAGTVQALLTAGSRPALGTWIVTRGVHGVGTRAPELAAVPQASVWGFVRTMAIDAPALSLRVVDLEHAERDLDQLVDVLSSAGRENQLAIAGGLVHGARLARAERRLIDAPARWRADSSYMITGGLGGIGLLVAEEMLRGGARRLVLVARTQLPPRDRWASLAPDDPQVPKVAAVRRLEQMGASVHLASFDVSDERQVRAFVERFHAEGWPPLRGVVHCAGIIEAKDSSWDAFHTTLAGKAVGAWNLHRVLPDLEQVVFFSSIASVLPQSNAHYAAANAVLDALAAARLATGRPAISLSWGAWTGAGMTANAQVERYVRILETHGITGFTTEEGASLFRWATSSPAHHLMLARVDWSTAHSRLSGRPGASLFADLFGGDVRAASAALRETVLSLPEPKRRGAMTEGLRAILADVLQLPASSISTTLAFGKQGVDSLSAVELRNRLEIELALRLPASLAWNYPSLGVLAEHLLKEISAEAPAARQANAPTTAWANEEPAPVAAMLATLAGQSDEDVLRELRGGLA